MNTQIFIDIILGIAAFFGIWTINSITRTMERLDDDVRKMPQIYVTKEDNRVQLQKIEHDIDEVKKVCQRIFDKLDQKADKP